MNTKPRGSLDFVAAQPGAAGHPAETGEPGSLDPDTVGIETPKPGLGGRLKLQFSTLMRHFRKAPAFRAEVGHAPDVKEDARGAGESSEQAAPARPGLFQGIKAGFAAFARRARIPAAQARDEDEISGIEPVLSRKQLVIGGALLVLLMAGIGVAVWPVSGPPEKQMATRHDIASTISRPTQPESAPVESQTEVEALRKENAELQVRIEALKKAQPPQQAYVPPPRQAQKNASSSPIRGELTVGSSDPKATAMTLKEAIEAMNANSGDYGKKPAKK